MVRPIPFFSPGRSFFLTDTFLIGKVEFIYSLKIFSFQFHTLLNLLFSLFDQTIFVVTPNNTLSLALVLWWLVSCSAGSPLIHKNPTLLYLIEEISVTNMKYFRYKYT